jgi:hypothetical protein
VTAGFGPVVTLARGTDGALWYRVQGTGGGWSGWRSLSGRLLPGTGPAAVTTAGGDLAVAVIGTDHHIWLFSPTATQVYGWLDFGSRTSSTPGIANDSPRRPGPVHSVRARYGQRAVVQLLRASDRHPGRLDLTGRQPDLRAVGSHRADRSDVRLRPRN